MNNSARQAITIAVTSGKGGVGKTNIATNLAVSLANSGKKTCLFDADTGLANVNILLGLSPQYTIQHILENTHTMEEVILHYQDGVDVVPAASGIAALTDLEASQQQRLLTALQKIEKDYDYLIIDTAAGSGRNVTNFIRSAHYIILVITAEPTSLTDAFALLRIMKSQNTPVSAHVLVNMALNYADSMEVYKRFEAAVKKYLELNTHYLGYIIKDHSISRSISLQKPVTVAHPDTLASRCFSTLAAVVSKQFTAPQNRSFTGYWRHLLLEIGNSTEFSRQSSQHHITDRDIQKHDKAVYLQKEIRDFAISPATSESDIIDLLDFLLEIMTSWIETRSQQNDQAGTDMSQAIRDRISNICTLIEQGYNLPQAESAAREVMESLRAMNSRLSRKEQQLNQVLEILLTDVDLANKETASNEADTRPRKTLS